METSFRLLLVESDDYSAAVLEKYISNEFPYVDVDCTPPERALNIIVGKEYQIIVCDAFLRHDDRVTFVADLCRASDLYLIIITGDTTIRPDTFSPHVEEACIHHILYKPLNLEALGGAVHCAIQGLATRKKESK